MPVEEQMYLIILSLPLQGWSLHSTAGEKVHRNLPNSSYRFSTLPEAIRMVDVS